MQRGHGLRPKGMFRHVLSIWQGGLHELVELANWLGNVKSLQKAPLQVHFRSSTHFVPRMKHVLSHKHSNYYTDNTWPNTSGRPTSVRPAMLQRNGHHQLIDFIRKAMQLHSKNCIQCHLLDVKIFLSQSHWTTIFHMSSDKGLITDHFDSGKRLSPLLPFASIPPNALFGLHHSSAAGSVEHPPVNTPRVHKTSPRYQSLPGRALKEVTTSSSFWKVGNSPSSFCSCSTNWLTKSLIFSWQILHTFHNVIIYLYTSKLFWINLCMARLPGLLGHSPYLLVEVFCTFRQSIDVKFGPKGLSANAGEINQYIIWQRWAEKQKTAVTLNHRPTPGIRQALRYKMV